MQVTVRNACIARGGPIPASTYTKVYTVPAGFVLLLKQGAIRPVDSVDWDAGIYVEAADGSASIDVINLAEQPGHTLNWEGWVACNGGDSVAVMALNTAAYYWLSGAVLPYQQQP
jgi:hypothetical protein